MAYFRNDFLFDKRYKNNNTILQSYTGRVQSVDDQQQNLTQRYTVLRVNYAAGTSWNMGTGVVPPNNQGRVTPLYNSMAGDGPARDGVASSAALDTYTQQSLIPLFGGYTAFCGQRDDGFYADIQAVFDLGSALARNAEPLRRIGAEVYGPAPAPIARIRGRHRVRLLVKAAKGAPIQAALADWVGQFRPKGDIRVTVDIDPQSFY